MKYALCVKFCQHNLTIVIVHKLIVHGRCLESGLHSQKLSMFTDNLSNATSKRLWSHCELVGGVAESVSVNKAEQGSYCSIIY
jgi:hypothetical protein